MLPALRTRYLSPRRLPSWLPLSCLFVSCPISLAVQRKWWLKGRSSPLPCKLGTPHVSDWQYFKNFFLVIVNTALPSHLIDAILFSLISGIYCILNCYCSSAEVEMDDIHISSPEWASQNDLIYSHATFMLNVLQHMQMEFFLCISGKKTHQLALTRH